MKTVLTEGDLAGYWGAVAQIIPVLALAFVIEARLIVRRLSRKRAYARRGSRVRWAITFFVLALLLTSSEIAALQSLAAPPGRALSGGGYLVYWTSFVAVAASLWIVVTLPVSQLIYSSAGDALRWVELHVPWGEAQRLKRTITKQIEALDNILRRQQAARLDALMGCAVVLLSSTSELKARLLSKMEELIDDAHLQVLDTSGEFIKLVRSSTSDPLWAYRLNRWLYDDLVRQSADSLALRKIVRKQLRRIEKVTRADSPEFIKIQRANMAAAARMV